MTSGSSEKVYDGTALTNKNVNVTGDGFVDGEGATYDVTGTITYVGTAENLFTYTLNPNTLAGNYNIEVKTGKLIVTDGANPDDPKPVDDDLVVKKNAEEGSYELGDTVTFTVSATNIYNVAQEITLSEIEGVTLAQSTFADVSAGETVETTATYTVTADDVAAGSFTNTVTAKVGNIEKTAKKTVNTAEPKGHLTVAKETTSKPASGKAYVVGEKITYKITATNDGNVDLTNVVVTDDLTGDKWTVEKLEAGKSKEFTTSYTVTKADVKAGKVVNNATATADGPGGQDPTVVPGTTEDTVKDPDKKMYTITYDPNGGKLFGSTKNYSFDVAEGTVITIVTAPTRDGYTFTYWKGSAYQPGDKYTVTGDHTFTAQWKAKTIPSYRSTSTILPKTGDDTPLKGLALLSLMSLGAMLVSRRRYTRIDRR